METFGSGPYSPLGEFPSAQFLAMTADLPIFVTFGAGRNTLRDHTGEIFERHSARASSNWCKT